MVLAGCDDTGQDAAVTVPEQPAPAAAPTSIMRPDMVDPEPIVPPIAPRNATIGFGDASEKLSADAIDKLNGILANPQLADGAELYIGAHTDSSGSDAVNMAVSRKRGELVRDWFMEQGIAEERITLVPFGEQNPVQPNALPDGSPNEEGRRANRRVEVRVAVEPAAPALPREPTLAEELVDQFSRDAVPPDARDQNPGAVR
ncbi:OmpA family protein [Erythrobacter sp. NFXS35]|uniref:OmpA family protein n=1 Tax=Erythrobacter sp. NFXS35 TaxID=2818436 RepID=UPI0032E04FA8